MDSASQSLALRSSRAPTIFRESPSLRVIAVCSRKAQRSLPMTPSLPPSRPRDDRFGECELRDVTGGSDGERRCRAAADRVAGVRGAASTARLSPLIRPSSWTAGACWIRRACGGMKASVSVQRSRRRSRWRHRPRCSRPLFPRESILLFEPTTLEGAWLLDIERRGDERGFFSRGWCRRELEARGLVAEFVQNNIVWSARKGTIRGLHFQTAPFQETKLVRCTRGAIWDVIIDLRPGSSTYLEWAAFELTAAHRRQTLCAEGFRARLPDAGGRHRSLLRSVRVLPARGRTRNPLGRSAVRHRLARNGLTDGVAEGSRVARFPARGRGAPH